VKREQRLRTPAEFRRVRDQAPRGWPNRLLVLYVASNELDHARVGVTVSSRVGNAVVRNRVRRRLREALRPRLERIAPGQDLLVVARPATAEATWQELCTALDTLLSRAAETRATSASAAAPQATSESAAATQATSASV
jgi:ribonuclease P protein component